jgi:hypothetical protein
MCGTQSLWISELAGIEESRQSELFIEFLRNAICQRCKNNVMTVSNWLRVQLIDIHPHMTDSQRRKTALNWLIKGIANLISLIAQAA